MDLGSGLKTCAEYSAVLPRACMKQERRSGAPTKQSSLTSCATGASHSFARVGALRSCRTVLIHPHEMVVSKMSGLDSSAMFVQLWWSTRT